MKILLVKLNHIGDTLRGLIPAAEQPVGRDDVTGRGQASNLKFWEQLEVKGLITAV